MNNFEYGMVTYAVIAGICFIASLTPMAIKYRLKKNIRQDAATLISNSWLYSMIWGLIPFAILFEYISSFFDNRINQIKQEIQNSNE